VVDRRTPVAVAATALATHVPAVVPPTHNPAPPAATVDRRTHVDVDITKVGRRAAVPAHPIHKLVQLANQENFNRQAHPRTPRAHIALQADTLSLKQPVALSVTLENIKSKVRLLPFSANSVQSVTNSSAKQQHVLSVQSTITKIKVHNHLFHAKPVQQPNIKTNWVKVAAKTTSARAPLVDQQLLVLVVLRTVLTFVVDVLQVKYFNQVTAYPAHWAKQR
jgi:hypothetical protein